MVVSSATKTSHLATNASHTMNTINITAVSEVKEPIEEMVFQVVYVSG